MKKTGVKEVAKEREIRSMGLEMLRLPEALKHQDVTALKAVRIEIPET